MAIIGGVAQELPRFEPHTMDLEGPHIVLNGVRGSNYVLETSVDLLHWTYVASGTATDGRPEWAQPDFGLRQQFYLRIGPEPTP